MRKFLTAFLSVALLLTACSENTSNNEQNTIQNNISSAEQSSEYDPFADSDDDASAAEQSGGYDPFAGSDDDASTTVGKYNIGVEWEEGKELILDYAPTVSFRYYVDNSGKTTDFGLLLFVNGIRQPYRTEEESENKIMHTFDVNQDERKVQTIEFEPVAGEKGDDVLVEIVSMFQPSFIQTENSNYEFNHRISSLYPSRLSVTQETYLSEPKVCSEYEITPISDELRQEFNEMSSTGASSGNALDDSVHIETLKNNAFYTPKDLREGKGDSKPFTTNDSVTLCMYGGKSCKYRVSMYINHELVTGAFDGADYIDMTPSRDSICKKMIDLEKLNLSLEDYNHLYFIAVPFYTNDNFGERMVIKSASVTLDNSKQE